MESRAVTPIFADLPEQSPEELVPKKIPIIERLPKLSPTLARFVRLKQRYNPFAENDPLDKKLLEKRGNDLPVAEHENGHVIVAKGSGATNITATVIQDLGYRGLTKAIINTAKSFKDQLHDRIRIALGGHAGEERGGQTDHGGTVSDMGQVYHFANILSKYFYNRTYSVGEIISDEFRNARRMVFGCRDFDLYSLHLTEQQTI